MNMNKELAQNTERLLQRIQEILEEEQKGRDRAAYGSALLEELATRLTDLYGKSFSSRNLRYMRQFYREFSKWNAVRSELSWTHYRMLLKVEKENSREFYMKEDITGHWSTMQLERQINSLYFARLHMSKDMIGLMLDVDKNKEVMQSGNIIKDPFILEFLDVKESKNLSESRLESALIEKLPVFVLFSEQRSTPGLKGLFLQPGNITGMSSPNYALHLRDIIS